LERLVRYGRIPDLATVSTQHQTPDAADDLQSGCGWVAAEIAQESG
jgi:hypothetical protein